MASTKLVNAKKSRDQQKYLKLIFQEYRKINKQIGILQVHYLKTDGQWAVRPQDPHLEAKKEFINYIDVILKMIPKESRDILIQQYVLNYTPGWWMEKYTHSTYYRHHLQAVEEFFSFYNA